MNIQILEQAQVICSNRNSIHNYFAWPTVARLPGGALAMAASGLRVKHADPFGKGILCCSFEEGNEGISTDLGCPASVELEDSSILTVFYGHLELGAFDEIMQLIWSVEA